MHFVPDGDIFTDTVYKFDILKHRLRELAFLNQGITITLIDEREDEPVSETYHYDGGIRSFVEHLNRKKEVLTPGTIYFNGVKDETIVEIALQYNESYQETIYRLPSAEEIFVDPYLVARQDIVINSMPGLIGLKLWILKMKRRFG